MRTVEERYIIDENGNKTDVKLSVSDYSGIIEDMHDLAVIAERRDEKTISYDEMEKRLSK